jgi:predicted phosphohydrolase
MPNTVVGMPASLLDRPTLMKIWALSDLHLSFAGTKPMDVFGEHWRGHAERVEGAWRDRVDREDVVCLPGDLSWAMRLSEARSELDWLGGLPGRKVLVKGNHDYWWASVSKVRAALPPGTYTIQNDAVILDGVAFAGARGWVDPSLDFQAILPRPPGEQQGPQTLEGIRGTEEDERIYRRELARLEASLRAMDPNASFRVALVHFPPTSPALEPTPVTWLLEQYRVDVVVFGHLHGPTVLRNPYGSRDGVTYHLVSADLAGFAPIEVASLPPRGAMLST